MQLATNDAELYGIESLRRRFGGLRIRDRGVIRPRFDGGDPNPGADLAMFRRRRLAARLGRKSGYSRSATMTVTRRRRRRGTSGPGVTTQHDQRMVYRKKNMPRRTKRRWRAFTRRVNFIEEKELGSRTVLFNQNIVSYSDKYTSGSGIMTVALYSQTSTYSWLSDLNQIAGLENVGNPTAAAGSTVDQQTKILFQSAVLDITLRNNCINPATGAIVSTFQLEVDIYEVTCRKDFVVGASAATIYATLGLAIDAEQAAERALNGIGSSIRPTDRGATPWECTSALSKLGLKIYKKTKYFIPAGNVITYQMRDPRKHKMTFRDIGTEAGPNRPGLTRWLLINYKMIPGIFLSATDAQERISVGITRKYMYKVEGVRENRSAYNYSGSATVVSPT